MIKPSDMGSIHNENHNNNQSLETESQKEIKRLAETSLILAYSGDRTICISRRICNQVIYSAGNQCLNRNDSINESELWTKAIDYLLYEGYITQQFSNNMVYDLTDNGIRYAEEHQGYHSC